LRLARVCSPGHIPQDGFRGALADHSTSAARRDVSRGHSRGGCVERLLGHPRVGSPKACHIDAGGARRLDKSDFDRIVTRLPFTEARRAHELLDSSASKGKLVLVP